MAGYISNQAFRTTDWRTRLQRECAGVFESGSILYRPKPRNNPDLRLFCLPHSGACAAAFRLWPDYLPENNLDPYARLDPPTSAIPADADRIATAAFRSLMDCCWQRN